jgi:hypothetical protein
MEQFQQFLHQYAYFDPIAITSINRLHRYYCRYASCDTSADSIGQWVTALYPNLRYHRRRYYGLGLHRVPSMPLEMVSPLLYIEWATYPDQASLQPAWYYGEIDRLQKLQPTVSSIEQDIAQHLLETLQHEYHSRNNIPIHLHSVTTTQPPDIVVTPTDESSEGEVYGSDNHSEEDEMNET